MKKIIHTIIVLFVSILISSCAKIEIVDFDKDKNTRTIKFTYENGKTKIVNQKFHLKSGNWFEVICHDKIFKILKDCPDNKIDFTKVGKMQIAELEINKQQSSSNEEQSYSNEEENDSEPDRPDPLNPSEQQGEKQGECGSEFC